VGVSLPLVSPRPPAGRLVALLALVGCASPLAQRPVQGPAGGPTIEAAPGTATAPADAAAPPGTDSASARARAGGEQPIAERPAWMRTLALPDLPLRWYPRVTQYLEQYRNEPRARETIRGWIRRYPAHREAIEAALEREQLPKGLAFVAMIESGFSPSVTSSRRAGGYWQFMPSVGRSYGLEVSFWVDERRDLEKSSAAAAKYLAELHHRFGTWELALAGYNAGGYAVMDSIVRYNTNDYATLCRLESGLPWETTEYVPKVLAVAIVERNRRAFGIEEDHPLTPPATETVVVPPSVSFDTLARVLHIDAGQLATLNPIYQRRRTPADRGPVQLRVPAGKGAILTAKALRELRPDNLIPTVVPPNETLARFAKARKVSAARLRLVNAISDDADVMPGATILVPRVAPARTASGTGPKVRPAPAPSAPRRGA
jgi:membrane-bound lytic murein transglycosylase D